MLIKLKWFLFLLLIFINKISRIWTAANTTTEFNTIKPNTTDINNEINVSHTKISGGYVGDPTLWGKYTVSIRRFTAEQEEFGGGHFCGGTIITRSVILTASHCFYTLSIEARGKKPNILVVAGAPGLFKYTKRTQVIKVENIVLHPLYDPITHHNDIALLILEHTIIVDGKTCAVATLPVHSPQPAMKCTAAGWGAIYYEGPKADTLIYADMIILSNEDCRRDYPRKTDKEICATAPHDISIDTCQGDSGGPLFCDNAVTGIVSRGLPCGMMNISGLYTSVYDYIDWIKSEKSQATINHYRIIYFLIYVFFHIFIIECAL